jgi:xylulokinase
MTSEAHPDPGMLTYSHVIPGMWYSVAATNAAALCQRWFRDAFCQLEIASEEKTGKKAFIRMGELAEKSPIGANGVMFHPYLQGERSPYWDPKLRASFTGVAISSGKGDFIRALFEGVAFSLLDCYGQIKNAGLEVGRIFLIGGGARSALWSQIISDVFNLSGVIPAPADASFGTALIAGTGVGIFPDSAAAVRKCLKLEREFSPDPAAVEKYRQLFETYREIHDALAPVYAKK